MKELLTVVTRKGQITIPAEIRRALDIKQGDTLAFEMEGKEIKLKAAKPSIQEFYQSVPALTPSRSLKEMSELAAEEHAQAVAREGLGD